MNGFGTAVDIVLGLIGAASIFLLLAGEAVSRWLRNSREQS